MERSELTATELVRECMKWKLDFRRLAPDWQNIDFSENELEWFLRNCQVGGEC